MMDVKALYDKDNTKAYHALQEFERISAESDELYCYMDDFFAMLLDEKSYVRVRGFRMICAQAKWDLQNKIDIGQLIENLDDSKPTVIRQKIEALHTLLLYKPEEIDKVKQKMEHIDLSVFKDSMRPLIEKDMEKLLKEF